MQICGYKVYRSPLGFFNLPCHLPNVKAGQPVSFKKYLSSTKALQTLRGHSGAKNIIGKLKNQVVSSVIMKLSFSPKPGSFP
jgi:hypothetical protein